MPEITKEQLAVIEAAVEWHQEYTTNVDGCDVRQRLRVAVDALPKPYQPLMPMQLGPEMRIGAAYLRAASARLAGAQNHGIVTGIRSKLCDWADEEEKLAKGE